MAAQNQGDLFDEYFRRADLDRDGKISGAEAVAFFQGSNLTKQVLAQIWSYADSNRTGFLGRPEFYNALKLVTVAQTKRELTPELVKKALYGPASAQIPAPQISSPAGSVPQSSVAGATPLASQTSTVAPIASQTPGPRGVPVQPNVNMNQQYNQLPVSGFMRPQNTALGVAARPVQGVGSHSGGTLPAGPNMPNSRASNDVGLANVGRSPAGVFPDRGNSVATNQPGVSSTAGPAASLPPNPSVTTGSSAAQPRPPVSQNGFSSSSFSGGDAFSGSPSLPRKDSSVSTSSAGSIQAPPAFAPVSVGNQSFSKQGAVSSQPNSLTVNSAGGQHQKSQSNVKPNQQIPVHNFAPPGPRASLPHNSTGQQPQLNWPRPTQTDLQKYTKVFMEVDTDKDGKITGEQARNLFLSWRLPRGGWFTFSSTFDAI